MLDKSLIRSVLSKNIKLDPYLVDVAKRVSSHRFLSKATQGVTRRMIELLVVMCRREGRDPASVKVLDWGAGKGYVSYLLKEAGFSVTSCDIHSSADDSAFGQTTPIIDDRQFHIVPLEHPWQLPFADGEFDLVVSFGVLEHVPEDNKSLQEIHRVLAANGRFFFCYLPYWLSWTQRLAHLRGNYYHSRLYNAQDVRRLAHQAGFRVSGLWHGQLFPKNTLPHSNLLERLDRLFTSLTPLKFFATNLEGVLVKE